jgi:hypothetical protein
MGISLNVARLIRTALSTSSFVANGRTASVLELGVQTLEHPLSSLSDVFGFKIHKHALDVDGTEGADIIWDLNLKVIDNLHHSFDIVIDGGTLEHVFDVRAAFENIFKLCAVDGYVIHISPCNNWANHGFFQLSPCVLIATHVSNGFEPLELILTRSNKTNNEFDIPIARFSGEDLQRIASTPRLIFSDPITMSQPITQLFISKRKSYSSEFRVPIQPFYDESNYKRFGILNIKSSLQI